MASNPLFGQAAGQNVTLASLLAGQNQMQDPAVAAFAPRLQLSQALLQQGTDTSPVASAKYGGISRLVSALAGLYGMQQASEGLNDIATKNRNDALALSSKWGDPFAAAPAPVAAAPQAPQAPAAPVAAAPVAAGGQGPGEVPAELLPHFQEASATTGIPQSVLTAMARQESSFNPAAVSKTGGTGLLQIQPSTAALPGFGLDGMDPSQLKDPRANIMFGAKYLAARAKAEGVTDWNDPQQVATALKAYNGGGDPNYVANVTRYLPQPDKGVQVAGPGAPTGGPQQGGGVPPSVTPGPVANAPQGAGVPGGGVPPAVTPGAVPQPPQTGINAPNVQRGLSMIKDAHQMQLLYPHNPQIQMLAQQHLEDAKTLMGLDAYQDVPGGQINQTTGKREYAPIPHTATDSAGNLLSFDSTGTPHVVAPVNPAAVGALKKAEAAGTASGGGDWVAGVQNGVPGQVNRVTGEFKPTNTAAPRLMTTPAGGVVASMPGTGEVKEVIPADNTGIAGRAAAHSQGTKTGEAAVSTLGRMVNLGHEADSAIGNIDYGINQLHQAKAGGINSGYFAPWLATAAAAGNSLGIDLKGMGIDPAAVGNVQSAQKTLAVVAGQILQNTIGKDSAITDAKIEHFIHAQPDIATDPNAIERVLGWARSQFTYNRDMAMHAMDHTDANGNLPPGWQASFYREKKAFAPIYDPLSQEMKQPQGQGPAPEMPKAGQPAPAAAAAPTYREGQTATGPGGKKMIFQGGNWVAQ
jgi:soluble lytic murein transglycosylase-like protein